MRSRIATTIKNPDLVRKKHDVIVEAAVRLINEKGFTAMTMRDISKATGIALGNLYAYIGSKDDILVLVHQRASDALMQHRKSIDGSGSDPVANLRRMIEVEFDSKNEGQDLVMLMYRESHKLPKSRLKEILIREEARIGAFEPVIQAGIAAGKFRDVIPSAVAHSIIATIDGWVLRRWTIQKRVSAPEMKSHIVDAVLASLEKRPAGDAGSKVVPLRRRTR